MLSLYVGLLSEVCGANFIFVRRVQQWFSNICLVVSYADVLYTYNIYLHVFGSVINVLALYLLCVCVVYTRG